MSVCGVHTGGDGSCEAVEGWRDVHAKICPRHRPSRGDRRTEKGRGADSAERATGLKQETGKDYEKKKKKTEGEKRVVERQGDGAKTTGSGDVFINFCPDCFLQFFQKIPLHQTMRGKSP